MSDEDYPAQANLATNDRKTRLEYGDLNNPRNHRLANALFLGLHFSSFIPSVTIPDDKVLAEIAERGGFPVQSISGKNWYELIAKGETPTEEHVYLVLQTISQMKEVWNKSGVLLLDRNPTNIIRAENSNVYQTDLDSLVDALSDGPHYIIDGSKSLEERKQLLIKNREAIEEKYQEALVGVLLILFDNLLTVIQSSGEKSAWKIVRKISAATKTVTSRQYRGKASFNDIFDLFEAALL